MVGTAAVGHAVVKFPQLDGDTITNAMLVLMIVAIIVWILKP